MNILLLDDNPHRVTFFQNGLKKHSLVVCRHAKAAIKALKKGSFDLVFLDHDLEGDPADPQDANCGSEVARFIAEQNIHCGRIILHTENRAGRESMEMILGTCESIPYGKLKKANFHSLLKNAREIED